MKLMHSLSLTALVLLLVIPAWAQRRRHPVSTFTPVTAYDPKRDAERDLAAAIRESRRSKRNILLEVGGEWCSWCHRLDKFFSDNPSLSQLRDQNFVTVKINFSDQNKNEGLLSRYPAIEGYPHIFFLDSEGKLLLSQDTGELESGKSYNLDKLTEVLTRLAPVRTH